MKPKPIFHMQGSRPRLTSTPQSLHVSEPKRPPRQPEEATNTNQDNAADSPKAINTGQENDAESSKIEPEKTTHDSNSSEPHKSTNSDANSAKLEDNPVTVTINQGTPNFPSSSKLMLLRSQSNSRRNFAKRLAVVTYTEEERFESNVNGKAGKKQLQPEKMEKIKDAVFLLYPLDVGK